MTPIMPQVKNIVMLMLENRSLDNLLGWLYDGDRPEHVFPRDSPAAYDGLVAGRYFNPAKKWTGKIEQYPVVPVPDDLGSDLDRVPAYDPYEPLKEDDDWNGVMNQLYGDANRIAGLPNNDGPEPGMLGFLQDYYSEYMLSWKGLDILWAYTPGQMPVINWLARNYAVSDQWFCSVPSQTNPNRAFSLCGTSLGRESNLVLSAVEQFDATTVFNQLATAGKSWGLYFTDVWKENKSYTEYTFPWISQAAGSAEIADIPTFMKRAHDGQLPQFTYLEPEWLRQGHDLQAGHRLPPADPTEAGRGVPGGRVQHDPTGAAVERDAVRGDLRRARRHLRPPSAAEDDQPGVTARRLGVQLRPPRRPRADDPGVALRRGRDGLPCARRQRSPLRPHVAGEDTSDVGRRRSGVCRHGRPDAGRADLRGCARRRSRERRRRPAQDTAADRGRAGRGDGEPPARGGVVRRDEGDRQRRRRRRRSRGRGQPLPRRPGGVRGVTRPSG